LWINNEFTGSMDFKGRSMDSKAVELPLSYVFANAKPATEVAAAGPSNLSSDLIMAKEGPGRLYYRIAMKVIPNDLQTEATSNGFSLERVYLTANGATIYHEDPYRICLQKGETYTVRLTIVRNSL
jgi:hypothetical protein